MAKIDTLIYELGIDEKDFERAIKNAEGNFERFRKEIEQSESKLKVSADTTPFKKNLQSAENQFKTFTKNIIKLAGSIVFGAGITSQMKDAINSFANFEEAMKQVTTLTNASDEELRQIEDTLLEIAKAGDFSATELANAYYQALSATGDLAEAMAVLQEANKAAIGGNADLFQSVDGLTSMFNAWKLSIDDLAKTNDLIFTAMRMGKTTIDEIAGSIGRVAPLAAQAGVGIDEVLTAVAALTLQGSSTAEAMTQLRGIFSSLIKPSEQSKKMAEELGIQFDVTALKSKGLQGVLNDVAEATEGNSAKMAMLFGEVEALNGVLALTGKGAEDFAAVLSDMEVSAGATDEAVAKMETGLKDTMDRLKGLIDVMKIEVARVFAPFLTNVVEIATGFFEWIQNMSDAEKAILGVSSSLIVIIPLVKQIYTWITLLKTATMGWVGALQAIAGVTIAVTTIKGISDEMKKLEEATIGAKDSAEGFTDTFKFDSKAVSDVSNEMKAISSEIENARRNANNLNNALIDLQDAIIDYNTELANGTENLDDSKKRIDDILQMYPDLEQAIEVVNGRYTIQREELQNIIDLEQQRLQAQYDLLQQRKAMLELEMSSEYYKQQKQFVEENIKANEEALNQLKNDTQMLQDMYKSLLETPKESLEDLTIDLGFMDLTKEAGSTVREIEKEFERLQLPIEDIAKQWGINFDEIAEETNGVIDVVKTTENLIDELNKKYQETQNQLIENTQTMYEFAEQEAELKILNAQSEGLKSTIDALDSSVVSAATHISETVAIENERLKQLQQEIEYHKGLLERYKEEEEIQAETLQNIIKLTENLRDEEISQAKSVEEKIAIYDSYIPVLENYQKQLEDLGIETKKSLEKVNQEIANTQSLLANVKEPERQVDLLNDLISLTQNRMDLEMDLAKTEEERISIFTQYQDEIDILEDKVKALSATEEVAEDTRTKLLNDRIEAAKRLKETYTQEEDQIYFLNKIISAYEQLRDAEADNAKTVEERIAIFDKYYPVIQMYKNELEELTETEEAATESTIDKIKADIEDWNTMLNKTKNIDNQIEALNNLISLTERLKDEEMNAAKDREEAFAIWEQRNAEIKIYQDRLEALSETQSKNIDNIEKEIETQQRLLDQATSIEKRIELLNNLVGLYERLRDTEIMAAESTEEADAIYWSYENTINNLKNEIEELSDTEMQRIKALESEFEKATGERKKLIAEELQAYYKRQAKLNIIDEEEYNRLMNNANEYEAYLNSLVGMEGTYIEQAKELLAVLDEHPETMKELETQIAKIKMALEELNKIRNELVSKELDTSEIDNFIEDLNNKLEDTQNRITEINQELENLVKSQLEKGLQEVGDLLMSIGQALGQDWSFFADILREIPAYLEQIKIAQELMNLSNPLGWIVLVIDLLERVISLVDIWNNESVKSEQLAEAIAEQQREINEYVKERIDLNKIEETSLQKVWNQYQNNQKTVAEIEKAEDELTKMMEKRKKVLQEAKEEEDKWDFLWWGTDEERVERLENEAAQLDKKIEEQKRKIEELKNELITSGEFASALGVGAEDIESDIISALENALSGTNTYEDFVRNFSESMEESLRNAIIKAMVAKALQQQIDALVQMISESYSDAELTQEELETIRAMYEALISQSESVYEDIKALGFDLGETGGGQGEYSGATEISRTITEETANRMIDYLTTFLIHLQNIERNTYETANVLKNGIIKVSIQESTGITIEEIKQAQGT